MDFVTGYRSPLGKLTLASDGDHLIGLWLPEQKYFGATLRNPSVEREDLPVFRAAEFWLEQYFSGARPNPTLLPLAPRGTDFQRAVWRVLSEIPYGKVVTYGGIAQKMAEKTGRLSVSPRAVGGAVGRNPISIIIPCHRVIGSDGRLTGYAGGLEQKRFLLENEGLDPAALIPLKGAW